MRCHNLAGAALTGLKNAWQFLTVERGCSPSIMHSVLSLALVIALNISFYRRIIRRGPATPGSNKKPALQLMPALDRFPWEPFVFWFYNSSSWISHAGLTVLRAFQNDQSRSEMWEGMNMFSKMSNLDLFWIAYFVGLEIVEIVMTRRMVLNKYYAAKSNAMLPVVEEKEVVPVEEKQVSIYEAIAEPPTPLESESLLADSESNTIAAPRPSMWQRIKARCTRSPPVLTAETVLARYYTGAFVKCHLAFSFAVLANRAACSLNPKQYFDGNQDDEFPVMLAGCALWTISAARLLIQGRRFAKAELKERRAVAL